MHSEWFSLSENNVSIIMCLFIMCVCGDEESAVVAHDDSGRNCLFAILICNLRTVQHVILYMSYYTFSNIVFQPSLVRSVSLIAISNNSHPSI